jgi:hypothetical protein
MILGFFYKILPLIFSSRKLYIIWQNNQLITVIVSNIRNIKYRNENYHVYFYMYFKINKTSFLLDLSLSNLLPQLLNHPSVPVVPVSDLPDRWSGIHFVNELLSFHVAVSNPRPPASGKQTRLIQDCPRRAALARAASCVFVHLMFI